MSKGKNVSLGKLREAVGQNKPGKPWSPAHLNGAQLDVLVTHRADKDTGDIYAEVKRVAAPSR
jgi:hypothetical protein